MADTATAQELLSPEFLPDLVEDSAFKSLSFPDRQKTFEHGVGEAAQWVTQNGGWTPETFTGFRQSVQALRGRVTDSESAGEWTAGAARTVGRVVKDSIATIGTTALDSTLSSPPVQIGRNVVESFQTGEAPKPLRAPNSDVSDALGRNLGKLGDSARTAVRKAAGPADEAVDGQLNALDAEINQGAFLKGDPKAWLKGQADAMEGRVRDYYKQQGTDPDSVSDYLSANRMDSKANLPLMLRYLATGDPKARTALREKLLMQPQRAAMEQRDEAATADSDTGKFLDGIFGEGTSHYVSEAGDPLEVLGTALSFFGGKAATTAIKTAMKGGAKEALKLGGKAALGAAGEIPSEMGSLFMDNPDATAEQYKEVAKDAAIGSLGLAGLGGGYQMVSDAVSSPVGAEMPTVAATPSAPAVPEPAPLAPGQEGATDEDFAALEPQATVLQSSVPTVVLPRQPTEPLEGSPAASEIETIPSEATTPEDSAAQPDGVSFDRTTGNDRNHPDYAEMSGKVTGVQRLFVPDATGKPVPISFLSITAENGDTFSARVPGHAPDSIVGRDATAGGRHLSQNADGSWGFTGMAGTERVQLNPEKKGFTNTAIPPATERGFVQLPEEFKGAFDHGIELVRTGIKDFAKWSVEMVTKFGEAIKTYLKDLWAVAQTRAGTHGQHSPGSIEERLEKARTAATRPNAPEAESKARPLKDEFGGAAQDYTKFVDKEHQARAKEIVDHIGSVDQMARLLSSEDGVRSLGLSPDLQTYVQAETLKRAHAAVESATNDVDRIRATATARKVRAIWDVAGTEAGQAMAARNHGGKSIRDELPAATVDTAIEKQQQATIDKALPVEPVKQVIEKAAADAGPQATAKVAETLDEIEAKRGKLADEKAGKLIYEVSRLHRQAGDSLTKGPNADNIRQVFRDHVSDPLTAEEFYDRLHKLGVSDPIIARLDVVAGRERAALDQMAQQKAKQRMLDKDSGPLAKLLNELRKKMLPGMNWRDIFTSQKHTQREWELEVYDRIRKHQALQGLSPSEAVQLTRELSKAWQRERRTVFNRELEKQLSKVAGVKPAAAAKVKASAPRLLQLINLGAFDSAAFRDAVAKEWGIKDMNSPEAKRLKDIGMRMQQAPEGVPRRKLAQQFIEGLQDLTKLTKAQLLDSWWTAAVLSGWRTHMDIGLGVLNGIEDVGLGAIVTAIRSGNLDVAWRAIGKMLKNMPQAFQESLLHLAKGDKSFMRKFDEDVASSLEDGQGFIGNAGRQLWNKGGFYKFPGAFLEFISRALESLDHFNSSSTREGAKMMAMARHPEIYKAALSIGPRERANARAQARAELTGGVEPKWLSAERVQLDARVKEILEQGVPTEIMAEASEIGRDAALQGDPSGLGALLQEGLTWLPRRLDQNLKAAEKSGEWSRTALRALRVASTLSRIAFGGKFSKSAGNFLNRSVSYVPGLGLARYAEGSMRKSKTKGDILIAKQLLGTAIAIGGVLLYYRKGEDNDEEGIEGSWAGLSAEKKSQLLAQDKHPNTVWKRDASGRVRSFNYLQWGVATMLNVVGSMEDRRRYHGDNDTASILVNALANGAMAVGEKAQMQGLMQAIWGDSPHSTNPANSLADRLNKWSSNTVGGVIPRIIKDVDAMASPELRQPGDWWTSWAAQVPMLREHSSGKRMNIFGEYIKLDRSPTSRVTQVGTSDPAYRTLGRLNQRDLWLSDPMSGHRKVKTPDGKGRDMTPTEKDRYQQKAGEGYKAFILEHGAEILAMPQDRAKKYISDHTEIIRKRAAYQATH